MEKNKFNLKEELEKIKGIGAEELQKEFPISIWIRSSKKYDKTKVGEKAKVLGDILADRCGRAKISLLALLSNFYPLELILVSSEKVEKEFTFFVLASIDKELIRVARYYSEDFGERERKLFMAALLNRIASLRCVLEIPPGALEDWKDIEDLTEYMEKNDRGRVYVEKFVSEYYEAFKVYDFSKDPQSFLRFKALLEVCTTPDMAGSLGCVEYFDYSLYPLKFLWIVDYLFRKDELVHPSDRHPLFETIGKLYAAVKDGMDPIIYNPWHEFVYSTLEDN